MSIPFIKIPKLQINRKTLLEYVTQLKTDDWKLLPWGQYVFFEWNNNVEISKLRNMFKDPTIISVIECMKFNAGAGLPIHKDNKRLSVIQIPLSLNCTSTPTLFYNENKEMVNQINWVDDSSWMFDTYVFHSVTNTSLETRYMLCISFYNHNYLELSNLYKNGDLLV